MKKRAKIKNTVMVRIPSHPRYLCIVRDVTSKVGELNGINALWTGRMMHAVDEACSNIIKYAYEGDSNKEIIIKYELKTDAIEIIIEDSGRQVKPSLVKGRSLDDIRPGGLGTHLIKRAFDITSYDEKKTSGNRLRLIKYLHR